MRLFRVCRAAATRAVILPSRACARGAATAAAAAAPRRGCVAPGAARLGAPLSRALSLPAHEVRMPALSPTMEAGTIAAWKVAEGESFKDGDVLAEVETDKATVDFVATDEGVVAKLLVAAGAGEVKVGEPVIVVVEEAADVAAFASFAPEPAAAAAAPGRTSCRPPTPSARATRTAAAPCPAARSTCPAARSTPRSCSRRPARHLAESQRIDVTGLRGSGRGGRIMKGDVIAALAAGTQFPPLAAAAAAPAPAAAAASAAAAGAAPRPPRRAAARSRRAARCRRRARRRRRSTSRRSRAPTSRTCPARRCAR